LKLLKCLQYFCSVLRAADRSEYIVDVLETKRFAVEFEIIEVNLLHLRVERL